MQEVSHKMSKVVEDEKANLVNQNSLSEIIRIEYQQLHGDWLTITRRKKKGNKSCQVLNKKKARF